MRLEGRKRRRAGGEGRRGLRRETGDDRRGRRLRSAGRDWRGARLWRKKRTAG